MTTNELRHQVINRVIKLEDENLLNDLIKLIENSNDDNEIYRLSNSHKNAINVAINQIERGDFLTDEQSNKMIEEWLNK